MEITANILSSTAGDTSVSLFSFPLNLLPGTVWYEVEVHTESI